MTTVQLTVENSMALRRATRLVRPATANQLHAFVLAVLGFDIPRLPLIDGHDAPFAYVEHAFFERSQGARDCIVWANRGGGKTQIAAIATLLDLLFKPGIQIRILGGSFDQSSKMYRYLKQMLESDVFNDLIAGNLTGRHVELVNGSRVEVLSQSERSVRGQRVHKLRCDEVELFDRDVWEAAQLVTRSGQCGPVYVRAAIEALSTMHRPFGLMQKLVSDAQRGDESSRRVFRWSALDVLRRCEPARSCQTCPLWDECCGRAKQSRCRGFLDIDDAIVQKRRVSPHTWEAEMLCEQPSRADNVYPEFDPAVHVFDDQHPTFSDRADVSQTSICGAADVSNTSTTIPWKCRQINRGVSATSGGADVSREVSGFPGKNSRSNDPIEPQHGAADVAQTPTTIPWKCRQVARRSDDNSSNIAATRRNGHSAPQCIAGIDFGHRAPTVVLWALVHEDDVIEVVDELFERDRVTDDLIRLANDKSAAIGLRPQWIGADPAGHQRSEQTGRSTIACWQRAGWRVRTRVLPIEPGIEAVRRRLRRADGSVGLRIHRRCRHLIEALSTYHYPQDDRESATPVKDGPDHACDALRYMITNLDHDATAVRRREY